MVDSLQESKWSFWLNKGGKDFEYVDHNGLTHKVKPGQTEFFINCQDALAFLNSAIDSGNLIEGDENTTAAIETVQNDAACTAGTEGGEGVNAPPEDPPVR